MLIVIDCSFLFLSFFLRTPSNDSSVGWPLHIFAKKNLGQFKGKSLILGQWTMHLTRSCIGNTKAAAAPAKAGSRELYKLRLVKLHGHWLEKKTILWKKNEHSRWLYSIQGAIFPRLIITSSGVDTQVTSESVLIRFESVPMFVSTFLWHSYKCQASCRVSSLGDFKNVVNLF